MCIYACEVEPNLGSTTYASPMPWVQSKSPAQVTPQPLREVLKTAAAHGWDPMAEGANLGDFFTTEPAMAQVQEMLLFMGSTSKPLVVDTRRGKVWQWRCIGFALFIAQGSQWFLVITPDIVICSLTRHRNMKNNDII